MMLILTAHLALIALWIIASAFVPMAGADK
jgi:hypothetical protein